MCGAHAQDEYVDRIRNAFEEAASSYDAYSSFQKSIARKLVKLLGVTDEKDRVLDVGCGTGHVGKNIEGKCALYQLDVSEKMCKIAQEKNEAVLTVNGNMTHMPFKDEVFTAVVSSMAIHWGVDMSRTLKDMIRVLNKEGKGIFIAIPIEGTFKELLNCYQMLGIESKHEFHSIKSIKNMVSSVGAEVVDVECEQQIMEHRTFYEFVNFLRKTGSHIPKYVSRGHSGESIKKVSSAYSSRFSNQGKIVNTWNVAYLVIKRKFY